MSSKSARLLLVENREARKILSELSALLGVASQPEICERKEFMPIIAGKTVQELAVEIPNATRVFEKLGIDYCCGGHKPLDEACEAANISMDQVLLALEHGSVADTPNTARDWSTAPLAELVDHIINKHHSYVKSELPRLEALIAKVTGVHGAKHPELAQVQSAFQGLANELTTHLMKEEQILFPYIKMTANGTAAGPSCFGSVQNPIRMMMFEHDAAGEKLREMRMATNNYTLPADACFSYGTLFNALVEFEQDLHQHIHLENNILFPRAVALER